MLAQTLHQIQEHEPPAWKWGKNHGWRPVHNNQGRTTIANWSHSPLSCQRLSVQETTCTVEGKPWPDYYNKLHFDCQSEWHQCNDQQLFGNPFPWMQHYPASNNHAYKVGETNEEHILGVLIKGCWGTLQLPFPVLFRGNVFRWFRWKTADYNFPETRWEKTTCLLCVVELSKL